MPDRVCGPPWRVQECVAIGLAPLLRPADSRSGGFRGSWRLPRSGGSHGSRAILSRGLSGGSRARFLEGSAWSHSIAHDQCFIREAFAQNRGRCGGVAAKARPHQRRQASPVAHHSVGLLRSEVDSNHHAYSVPLLAREVCRYALESLQGAGGVMITAGHVSGTRGSDIKNP